MKNTRHTKELPCRLTSDELAERADHLVERMDALETSKATAKTTAEQFKKEANGIEVEIGKLQTVIRSHKEPRTVECATVPLYSAHAMVTVRLDSGAEVSRRPLTDNERTPDLFSGQKAEGAEGEEVIPTPEEVENDRIIKLLELSDMLRTIEIGLNMESLWELTAEEVDESRGWTATVSSLQEGEARPDPPLFLTVLIDKTKKEEAAQEERDALVRRTCELLDEAEIVVDHILVAAWSPDQLNEASDYAERIAQLKSTPVAEGEDVELPERPSFLPAPPAEPTNGAAAASAQ